VNFAVPEHSGFYRGYGKDAQRVKPYHLAGALIKEAHSPAIPFVAAF